MNQLKILVVVPHYFPAIGGVETYSQAVVEKLKKDGHEVTIVTTKLPQGSADDSEDRKNSIMRLTPWMRVSNTPISPLWYFQIRRIIKKIKPNAIHVHSPVPFLADMVVLAVRKRIPVLMTYHAGSMIKGSGMSDAVIKFYERYVLPRIFRKVSKIGAVLPRFVKTVASHEKIEFTPPGIDTDTYVPNPKTKRTTDIIFAGRIESTSDWKGLDIFLQAVALVKKTHPNIVVQVVGQGDAVDSYRQLAVDLSIEKNVTFITNKRGNEMVALYQSAKIIALPSKTEAESFGMVLAEAMACGVAPVGSRIGGIPNIIQHAENGLLVPPGDSKELAKSIRLLIDDPLYRKKLAKNARRTIETKFTHKMMTDKNTQLLYELAKKEVVHVCAYYPPHLGGMEQAINMLVTNQYEKGIRVKVVTSAVGGDQLNEPFTVNRLSAFEVVSTPMMPRLLWELLRQSPRSIFHVHVAQAGIPEVAYIASRLKRIPLVLHLHGDVEASSAAGILLPIYKKVFLGFVLRRADVVIVPTNTYKQTMSHRYKLKNPVYVIPAGIDKRFLKAEASSVKNAIFTVLFVGRLTVEKNVDLLIHAIQEVTYPIRFIIIGDGGLRSSLEKLAEKTKREDCEITFAGKKAPNELVAYYQQADALVLGSNYESQSLVVLEAMAIGVPVIVANVAAVNEIVGEAGMLVDKTPEAFTHAITQLVEKPEMRRGFAKKGQARARRFDWDVLTAKFEDVYEELG